MKRVDILRKETKLDAMEHPAPQHFSTVLREALSELELTQQQFSEQAGISVALLTKIFRGEPVHRKSLRLVLAYFQKQVAPSRTQKTREIAAKLIKAYQHDMLAELGCDDDELASIGLQPDLLSQRDRAILSLFQSIPKTTLLALHCVGKAAQRDEMWRDALFAQADLANSQTKQPFPPHFFHQYQNAVNANDSGDDRNVRLVGGSMGEILAMLSDDENQHGEP